jgi:hypothetical protein
MVAFVKQKKEKEKFLHNIVIRDMKKDGEEDSGREN